MTARLRYLVLTAARTRTPLPPLAAALLALAGVYAYRGSEVGATWGLTALLCCALAAWLAGAVVAGEPAAQADMAAAALGGRRGRAGLELVLVLAVAVLLAALFVTYPWALGLFDRPPRAGDALAAGLAHLSCAATGGALGVLFAPPRVRRRATAAAAVLASLLVLAGALGPLGPLGGPAAVARALVDARPGTVPGAVLLACLSCLALAAIALAVAHRWGRRSG